MTIPDWLQAIQNYMKTLQYPSSQGLSPASQGASMMITSLEAYLPQLITKSSVRLVRSGMESAQNRCEYRNQSILPPSKVWARVARVRGQ